MAPPGGKDVREDRSSLRCPGTGATKSKIALGQGHARHAGRARHASWISWISWACCFLWRERQVRKVLELQLLQQQQQQLKQQQQEEQKPKERHLQEQQQAASAVLTQIPGDKVDVTLAFRL